MTEDFFLWITRVGLIIDMAAFWFVAPELLGQQRMNSISKVFITKWIRIFTLPALFILIAVFWIMVMSNPSLKEVWGNSFWNSIIWTVGAIATGLIMGFSHALEKKVEHLFIHLAEEPQARRKSLIIGALMFMIGFFLQFIGTF